MSDATTNLQLPFLAAAQAQKHVTVNEALLRLDALVQCVVRTRSLAVQPPDADDGALYMLPHGKTGPDWGPMSDLALAYHHDGVWEQLTPKPGWTAWIADESRLVGWTGTAWVDAAAGRVLSAGDTMTGALALPADGLAVGGVQLVTESGRVGVGAGPAPGGARAQISDDAGELADFVNPTAPAAQKRWRWSIDGNGLLVLSTRDDAGGFGEIASVQRRDGAAVAEHMWFTSGNMPRLRVKAGGQVNLTPLPALPPGAEEGDLCVTGGALHVCLGGAWRTVATS